MKTNKGALAVNAVNYTIIALAVLAVICAAFSERYVIDIALRGCDEIVIEYDFKDFKVGDVVGSRCVDEKHGLYSMEAYSKRFEPVAEEYFIQKGMQSHGGARRYTGERLPQ